MNGFTALLLTASVACSTVRAVFSKRLGIASGGKREFCKTQAELFFFAAAVIFLLNIKGMCLPTGETLVFGVMYGIFTVLAQWLYTVALGKMPVSVCAMVYSFGFIIPTVFGTVMWNESIGFFKIISVLLCVVTIILSSLGNGGDNKKTEIGAVLPLIISMIASGGLGVVQKLQQKSDYPSETGAFLVSAFLLAGIISALAALTAKKENYTAQKHEKEFYFSVIIVGAAMAAANTANTLLAGRLPSVIAFPITNVGVILASLLVSVLFLKEKITGKQIAAMVTGIAAVVMFNL